MLTSRTPKYWVDILSQIHVSRYMELICIISGKASTHVQHDMFWIASIPQFNKSYVWSSFVSQQERTQALG